MYPVSLSTIAILPNLSSDEQEALSSALIRIASSRDIPIDTIGDHVSYNPLGKVFILIAPQMIPMPNLEDILSEPLHPRVQAVALPMIGEKFILRRNRPLVERAPRHITSRTANRAAHAVSIARRGRSNQRDVLRRERSLIALFRNIRISHERGRPLYRTPRNHQSHRERERRAIFLRAMRQIMSRQREPRLSRGSPAGA